MKSTFACLAIAASCAASSCEAALVAGVRTDLVGTGFKALMDTDTGLDWLSPVATRNRTIAEVLSGHGGWVTQGYRYATSTELQTLLEHAGLAGAQGGTTAWSDVQGIMAMDAFITRLGWTYEDRPPSQGDTLGKHSVYGILADLYLGDGQSPPSRVYATLIGSTSNAGVSFNGQWLYGSQDNLVGSFLVRDQSSVPEPSSVLLVLGALAMSGACTAKAWRTARAS